MSSKLPRFDDLATVRGILKESLEVLLRMYEADLPKFRALRSSAAGEKYHMMTRQRREIDMLISKRRQLHIDAGKHMFDLKPDTPITDIFAWVWNIITSISELEGAGHELFFTHFIQNNRMQFKIKEILEEIEWREKEIKRIRDRLDNWV